MLAPSEDIQYLELVARDMRHFDLLPKVVKDAFNNCLCNCLNTQDALIALHRGMSIKEILGHIRRNELAAHELMVRAGEVPAQSTQFVLEGSARRQRRLELRRLIRKNSGALNDVA